MISGDTIAAEFINTLFTLGLSDCYANRISYWSHSIWALFKDDRKEVVGWVDV